MDILPTIIIIVLIILIIIYILYTWNKKNKYRIPYMIRTEDGFGGVKIRDLKQSSDFYAKNRETTLQYLSGIYPTAKKSMESLNNLELASFYNSLWFYFNCQGEYTDDDLKSLTGKNDDTKWGPLPCKDTYPIPYTPQGWLYNFWTYQKYNVPEVFSDSDSSKIYLQPINASSNRAGVMGTYNNDVRSSGIMWYPQRSIQRDIWYPNGIFNQKLLKPNQLDNWRITVGNIPEYNFPHGWYGKLSNHQYIEVTHGPSNTGDALNMSPFWWYNGAVGSGLFLNLGKTLAVKNKIAGIFEQAKMLANTEKGRDLLMKWYNTIDPYKITFGILGLCGYNLATNQYYCDFTVQACGIACDPGPIGYAVAAGIDKNLKNFYQETIDYQNKVLGESSNIPTTKGIIAAIDAARNNQNYNLAHVAEQLLPDETNFFFGINLGFDTIQFYEDPNGNDNYCFELIDLRIPDKYKIQAKNRDYSGFMNINNKFAGAWSSDAMKNSYKKEAIDEYLKNAYDKNWLSIRDPFDIHNENKVKKCTGIILSNVCKDSEGNSINAHSMYCKEVPLLNEYKCLALGNEFTNNTCVLSGPNPTC